MDGYGAFDDATFDPVGALTSTSVSYESGLAVRLGSTGPFAFLTTGTIGGSGGLSEPTVTGDATHADSMFSYGGLEWTLHQELVPRFAGAHRVGSELVQVYTIVNPGPDPVSFELVRYFDADVEFDGEYDPDGGGRTFLNGMEVLFTTDTDSGVIDGTTFVGITAEGGVIPTSGRFEVSEWDDARSDILNGFLLSDTVEGDGDADGIIDAGSGYDVTMALRNVFTLGADESVTYTTRTIFGVPDGGHTLALLLAGLGGIRLLTCRMRRLSVA